MGQITLIKRMCVPLEAFDAIVTAWRSVVAMTSCKMARRTMATNYSAKLSLCAAAASGTTDRLSTRIAVGYAIC